jgi:hypothetical protein
VLVTHTDDFVILCRQDATKVLETTVDDPHRAHAE